MTILYVYTFDDPNGVGPIPPTFHTSEQGAKIHKAHVENELGGWHVDGRAVLMFNNEDEFTAWVNEHRITDPVLLADMQAWDKAYNIVHHHRFFQGPALESVKPLW